MEIKNATTVHRVWKTLTDAELVATFQYDGDAETFCKAALDRTPEGTHLIAVCHYSGKMTIFRNPSRPEAGNG